MSKFALLPGCLVVGAALSAGAARAQGPTVTASDPAPNALHVAAAREVRWTFSGPVDPTSIAGRVRMTGRFSGELPVQWRLDAASQVLTISPQRSPMHGELVTVWLASGVRTAAGVPATRGYNLQYWVRSGPGTRNFVQSRTIPFRRPGESSLSTYGIYAGDLDGDGAPDVLASNEAGHDLRILLNDGCTALGPMTVVADAASNWPSPTEGADMDGDGDLDIVTGNAYGNSISVYFNDGAGGLGQRQSYAAGGYVHGIALLDVDGDGDLDVAAPNTLGVAVFLNDGSGGLGSPVTHTGAGQGEDNVHAGDANGDGILDLFVGCLSSRSVGILLGDGNGGFAVGGTQTVGNGNTFQIAVGDLDGDGHADAVTANRTGGNYLGVHFGDGAGGFRAGLTYPTGVRPAAVDLGDLDGDGDLDAVMSCYSSGDYWVYWNDGAGGFSVGPVLPSPIAGTCATLVDFDRDGDLDIVAADEEADVAIIFLQGQPAAPGVQPAACASTLRVEYSASAAGFGTRPAIPVEVGGRMVFQVTGGPNLPFVLLMGDPLSPGVVLPYGRANLDLVANGGPLVLFSGLGGGPYATDARGEHTSFLSVPSTLALGSQVAFQAVVFPVVLQGPRSIRLSNPELVVFR